MMITDLTSLTLAIHAGEGEFPSTAARFNNRDDLLLRRRRFLGFAACDFSPIGCRSEEDREDEEANSPPPPSMLRRKSSSSATRPQTSPSPTLKSSSSTSRTSSASPMPPSSPLKSLLEIVFGEICSKTSSCTLKLLVQMLSFASFPFQINSNM